jgi:hypothetical protein
LLSRVIKPCRNLCSIRTSLAISDRHSSRCTTSIASPFDVIEESRLVKAVYHASSKRRAPAVIRITLEAVLYTILASHRSLAFNALSTNNQTTVYGREPGIILDISFLGANWSKRPLIANHLLNASLDMEALPRLYDRFQALPLFANRSVSLVVRRFYFAVR